MFLSDFRWRISLLCGGGFILGGGALFTLWHDEVLTNSREGAQGTYRESPNSDSVGRFEGFATGSFVTQEDWANFLSSRSGEEIMLLITQQPTTFWVSDPLAASVAYRLFGAFTRLQPDAGLAAAFRWSAGGILDPDARRACMRWAFIGVFENNPTLNVEDCFAGSAKEFWIPMLEAAVISANHGNISDDMRRFGALFSRLLQLDAAKTNLDEYDKLLQTVIESWIHRQPAAVLEWLRTPEGKPHVSMIGAAIASLSLGNKVALMSLFKGGTVSASEMALACFDGEWAIREVKALLSELPEPDQKSFLKSFVDRLATGTAPEIADFITHADLDWLTQDVANALAPKVLTFTPELFGRLSSNLDSDSRDKLLDDTFQKVAGRRVDATPLSRYYLRKRGVLAPKGQAALGRVAFDDLNDALLYVSAAPKERQAELTVDAYRAAASKLVVTDAPVADVLGFLQNAPDHVLQSVAEIAIGDVAAKNPDAALEILERLDQSDDKMWAVFFQRANLSPDKLNDLLGATLKATDDPSLFAAAASRITDLTARESFVNAQQTVELLPESYGKVVSTATLARRWAEVDAIAASEYVSGLAEGQGRDEALQALLPQLSFSPELFREMLSLASSDKVRTMIELETKKKLGRLLQR